MSLTKAEVSAALEKPMTQLEDGWKCRICPRSFPAKNAVAVHELVHRREVGLAPPPHRGNQKAPATVVCRYEGCEDVIGRTSLPMHMRSKKHGLSNAAASFWARRRREEDIHARNAPAVVEVAEPVEDGEPSVYTGLEAVDAIAGILSAARSDGLIPTRMLPAVHDLIQHTDNVLEQLRALS